MSPAVLELELVHVFETDLGWMGLLGTPRGLRQLTLGHPTPSAARAALPAGEWESDDLPEWMARAELLLTEYAAGERVDLSEIPLDLPPGTPFQDRVRRQLLNVRYGDTVSYGELAERAGAPRAARAVGTVMSGNPVPLVIPCHRVLGSGGRLGGYSAPSGLSMKQRLLKLESAEVTGGICR